MCHIKLKNVVYDTAYDAYLCDKHINAGPSIKLYEDSSGYADMSLEEFVDKIYAPKKK